MNRLSIILIFLLVLIDFTSKNYIKDLLKNNTIEVNNYLILDIYYNKGVAFSFLDSDSLTVNYFAFVLILGGALGNFIDRLLNQSVLDFIIIHYKHIYFPGIFNLADMFITIGVLMMLLSYFISKNRYD